MPKHALVIYTGDMPTALAMAAQVSSFCCLAPRMAAIISVLFMRWIPSVLMPRAAWSHAAPRGVPSLTAGRVRARKLALANLRGSALVEVRVTPPTPRAESTHP